MSQNCGVYYTIGGYFSVPDDVLREIEAQQRLAGGAGGYPDQQQAYLRSSDDYEDVERLGSYLDEFMGLDQPPAAAAGRRLPAAAAAPVEDQVLLREIEAQVAKIRFPRLTGHQKDFAVHPGYPHYYNHELRQIEDEIEKRKGNYLHKLLFSTWMIVGLILKRSYVVFSQFGTNHL